MSDYKPSNPKIFSDGEIEQAIEMLKLLLEQCYLDRLDEHNAPALLIALDCMSAELGSRKEPNDVEK